MPKLDVKYSYYVLHSPYPDKSWRGIEKSVSVGTQGTPLLFDTKADALAYAQQLNLAEFVAVEVELATPAVRAGLVTNAQETDEENWNPGWSYDDGAGND